MDKLPSKSLSKSILIATPLFCIVLALLDAADDLSYLFVLDFLGSVDLMFLPTTQPEIRSPNFQRNNAFKMQGVNITDQLQTTTVPIVRLDVVEQWARNHSAVRGVSPRWIVPVELPRTDSLLLVINSTRELEMGVGLQSGLQKLGAKEVALSTELMRRLGLKIGDSVSMTLTIPGLLRGGKLIQKYQSFESREQYVVQSQELGVEQLTDLLFNIISTRGKDYGIQPSRKEIHTVVEDIYNTQFIMTYKVKNQYKNKGLYPTTLHNVVLMEFQGFAEFLTELFMAKVVNSRPLEDALFAALKNANLPPAQILLIHTYYRSIRNGNMYKDQIRKAITEAVYKFPLMVISSFKNRQAIYSPSNNGVISLLDAMQSTPGEFQVISIYPFYQDLQGIRFFFKSVIQIFSFICAVIYYYIMTLIFKQIYEEKEIEVGIWRTLGAGGVRVKEEGKREFGAFKDLRERLTVREKVGYVYKMLVKVGFLYYWLASAAISAFLYWLMKLSIYELIVSILNFQAPSQEMLYPFLIFLLIFSFTIGLAILHIRQIYINPLVSTIKPVKRTFDIVKVRIIKIATFGITVQTLIIAVMLIYYGVVSYYEIPMSILYNDGWLQTILFNSIFICMIFGAIILLSILQSRMECLILEGLFRVSDRLKRTKLILLKTIKAKQYKNIKVAIIISVIFAFLLFFASGLTIETTIIQSFIQRQLGAQLVLQNYQANTFDRPKVQKYLDSVGGLRYSWLSSDLDNRKVDLFFQGIMKPQPVTAIFKVISSNYLDTTYYQYYYPQRYYEEQKSSYQVLPNGVVNGFSALFTSGGRSRGKYDPFDTIKVYDPKQINIDGHSFRIHNSSMEMAPEEQVINMVVTSQLRKKLGAAAGDYFKLHVSNAVTGVKYLVRCRILHSLKIGPGLDLFSNVAFFSQEQAEYLYRIVGADLGQIRFQKLFITGQDLSAVGNKILSISPEHTQLFQMGLVRQSFQTMTSYLQGFIALVTVILASLSILFLFVYTHGKCKEEAEVFKMLRAIGLPVSDIRLIIFIQILIRILVSIVNGILLGIFFSLGLSGQIQEVLMINTPPIKLDSISIIAVLMLLLFSVTVMRSTQYLSTRTVLETSKG